MEPTQSRVSETARAMGKGSSPFLRYGARYNKRTIRIIFNALGVLALLLVFCIFVISHSRPPQLVSPSWHEIIAYAAPGTTGIKETVTIKVRGKLDERFVVSWPTSLKVAIPEIVIVRIAANDYEDILSDIEVGRKTKTERFKGEAKLEVSLTPDSGLEVVKQHSETQVVVKGASSPW